MSVTVHAPSSTANLGPGFDVFGLALDAFYDKITLSEAKVSSIKSNDSIPLDLEKNTAGLVIQYMKEKFEISDHVEIEIEKGVPAGYGMGSSAASAAATAVAFDKLFNLKLDSNKLIECAGVGEQASAGTIHYDNVAASVLGGFVIVQNTTPLKTIMIEPPKDLRLCIVIPKIDTPEKKTQVSRDVIPNNVKFADSIENLAKATSMVAGFAKKDCKLIGDSVKDIIVEPARKHMIPGFDVSKKNAMKAGALGFTISGAGPAVIAFATEADDLEGISSAIKNGMASVGTSHDIICKPSIGARIQ